MGKTIHSPVQITVEVVFSSSLSPGIQNNVMVVEDMTIFSCIRLQHFQGVSFILLHLMCSEAL
jgi:hypothetical protein